MRRDGMGKLLLRLVCAFVLGGILVAGLWPFHAPQNQVSWLGQRNGLSFGKYGSIVSAGIFKTPERPADGSCSLEIWLEPARVRSSGTILAFYLPENQVIPFAMRRSLGDLVLQRPGPDSSHRRKKVKVYIDDVFGRQQPVLVSISSGQSGTTVYADGVLVRKVSTFRLSSADFNGRLIAGNSPVTTDNWSGQLRGLAIYDRELTADEVSNHFADWTRGSPVDLAGDSHTIALYRFDENGGRVAHNRIDTATDLLIPERFFLLHQKFLERPWDEYRPDWNYWKDVGINIAGFIPLGFFFCTYFWLVQRLKYPTSLTIAMGFLVSLTIEVLQAFLPTRNSGMTDLITNTFGTAVGVILCRWALRLEVDPLEVPGAGA